MFEATNTFAAFGFLLLGLLALVGAVGLFLTRQRWSERLVTNLVRKGSNAKSAVSRAYWFQWRKQHWQDDTQRRRAIIGVWAPPVVACLLIALGLFVAAAAHF